jgi:pilus assembly protein FimV
MLVAMLRANPDAFVQGNVNRVKAGAVLDLPTAQQAAAIPAAEASQTITAQSRDFNAFRRRLAANAAAVQPETAQRSASGRVQADVTDNRPANTAPDRLTLSKGGVQAKAAEERIATDKAASESAERVAELSRNITELNQLGAATGAPATAPPPNTAASAAGEPATSAAAPAATPAASAQAGSSAPELTAPAPAASAPASQASTRWVDRLLGNPLVPVAAGALIALLAGFGVYRARQRRKAMAAETAGSGTTPADSFFGSSGGQQVDTSALDAPAGPLGDGLGAQAVATEADPVAEADVYLAYGRDLQAEEILSEALRHTPERLALHAKLAEIHAKRRDLPAFEALAEKAHAQSGGAGPEWARIAELGRTLAPDHRLWAQTDAGAGPAALSAGAGLAAGAALVAGAAVAGSPDDAAPAQATEPPVDLPTPPAAALDFGIDLDLDLDPTAPPSTPAPRPAMPAAPVSAGLPPSAMPDDAATAAVPPPPFADDLDFDVDLDAAVAPTLPPGAVPTPAAPLDFGSLSLDLGDSPADEAATADNTLPDADDPLATKLALAEEFSAIGDTDGARALAEEVLAEATGPLKAQAERFLADLA